MSEMTFARMIETMTPDVYQSLKRAVELRKWPNGTMLTREQVKTCLDAVIAYEIQRDIPEEQRVGYLEGACQSSQKKKQSNSTEPQTWDPAAN